MENERRRNSTTQQHNAVLNLDGILTSQPELGPSIPDGGYGWIIFVGTLFFQALVPSLIVSFGIFLAFSKFENGTAADLDPKIWDDKLLYTPLFFMISRTFFDASTRALIFSSTWPRLVATGGTCLTSAGLLLMWMGMTGSHDDWLFVPAGILTGIGASLLMVQCEVLLAQYFRLKLPILHQTSQLVQIVGFILAPIFLSHHILRTSLYHVLLWYQAIILQGLMVSLIFKKPYYLKSTSKPYRSIAPNSNDEEDIFSKNSRELQIKRQTSNGSQISTIAIEPGPSGTKNWESFPENEEEEDASSSKKQWEKFEEGEDDVKYVKIEDQPEDSKQWVRFEEDGAPDLINGLSLAEEMQNQPTPLFTDSPVNNNTTYAYDEEQNFDEFANTTVFNFSQQQSTTQHSRYTKTIEYLKMPTFYKSLLMVVTNKYSHFIFYVLFPSYLFIEVKTERMRQMCFLMGLLALVNLIFMPIAYWVNINKNRRPLCLWACCWLGCAGYFMISDYQSEVVLLLGSIMAILSMCSLEHVGRPLMGLTIKGEIMRGDYVLFTLFSGIILLVFLFINITFKDCFRMMAILNFFTGSLWLGNYAYKSLRNRS